MRVTRSQTIQTRKALTTQHPIAATASSSSSSLSSATAAAPAASAARPAFNTNQQHYSPLKSLAPKPLTSTYLAPPSPSKLPANVALSAETSRLQTELLQLSLLHRDAGAVAGEWHASARATLGAQFAAVAADHEAVAAAERDAAEERNVAALLRWSGGGAADGLDERIQALDQVLAGVWAMSDPGADEGGGGRYARAVAGFEAWAGRMAEIVAAQRDGRTDELLTHAGAGGGGDEDDVVVFLSDLDTRWKDDCAGLRRKLEAWRRTLRALGPVPEAPTVNGERDAQQQEKDDEDEKPPNASSSLARVLDGCGRLIDDMLAELDLMEEMEREALRAEDEWIERMNKELGDAAAADAADGGVNAKSSEAPLWKMVI